MKNVYVYSYNTVSNGARELARALDSDRIRHSSSRFKGASFKTVINWGSSEVPREVSKCRILNRPELVSKATNKLSFFRSMTDDVSVVPWTDSKAQAEKWLSEKRIVVARTTLTGHSGSGIQIIEPGQELINAPLYTQYIFKSYEFRVHIIGGEIVAVQRKIRDPNREPTNWKVRSHDNGFMFVRTGFDVPKAIIEQSIKAFMASGLDFCGVDLIYNEKYGGAFILEVNTACGLEGQTIEDYANGFRKLLTKG